MARMLFCGGISDWGFTAGDGGTAVLVGGASITFWNQQTGGDQITDLTTMAGDPVTQVVTSNGAGSDGLGLGQIPVLFGPDGVFSMWASANLGPRALVTSTSLGEYFGPVRALIEAHLSAANPNPHETGLEDLVDVVNAGAATTGQLIGRNSNGTWGPVTVPGVGGTVQLAGDQTIVGTKTSENQSAPAAARAIFNAAESQSADVVQVWSSAAAGEGASKQKTASFNAKGEARFRPAKADSVGVQIDAQPGQSANVFEQRTSAGTVLSRMEPNGTWRAPNIGRSIMFAKAGTIAAGAGTFSWYNDTGVPLTVRSVRATVNTAPTGLALIVDVNLNGTTIFGTQANRPTIAVTTKTSGKATGMTVTTIPDGGAIVVDIDQIGSSVAGADLVVQVDLS